MGRSLLSIFQEEDDEEPHSQQKEEARDKDYSIERIFESKEVPPWHRQLTFRAFAVSFVLAVLFTFIVMKLNLTTGIIPSLNVSAGLLGFFFVKMWTTILEKFGMLKQPFTRQENTVIQTCVVAASGIAFSGGFGSYLFGMSEVVAKQSNEKYDHQNIKNPSVSWIFGFLFVVSFLGLCSVVPLRKIMLIDFNLIYPSGTATAHLINSFHTFHGAKQARRQIRTLGKFFSLSFLWGFFQWFFTAGEDCGFASFPTFGLTAYGNRFYFDFSTSYIGVGMMCPYMINISLLIGAILSWGLMWPLIALKEGTWYPPQAAESLRGLQGYKIFIAIAMILGDGVYNLVKVLGRTLIGLYKRVQKKDEGTNTNFSYSDPSLTYDQRRRIEFFLKDDIPTSVAIFGYICVGIASAAGLPHMFPSLKWYYMIFIYAFAPVLAFCNAYGSGLTDWSLASTYGKLAIFIVGAWAGPDHGGILAGLATCGVMLNIVSTASELTQDFKTGYMTLSSPRSMFISQLIGTAMGCVISPLVFWLFYKAASGSMGLPDSQYPAPYALVYRNMAVLGVNGFSILPTHCIDLCCAFFAAALIMNGARDTIGPRWARFIPIPMAMAIPFYIGGFFAIDMCVGSLILYVWKKMNRSNAEVLGPAMAAGLICGDGLWNLPSSLLTLNGVQPPICMKFVSREANMRLAAFSGGA